MAVRYERGIGRREGHIMGRAECEGVAVAFDGWEREMRGWGMGQEGSNGRLKCQIAFVSVSVKIFIW